MPAKEVCSIDFANEFAPTLGVRGGGIGSYAPGIQTNYVSGTVDPLAHRPVKGGS